MNAILTKSAYAALTSYIIAPIELLKASINKRALWSQKGDHLKSAHLALKAPIEAYKRPLKLNVRFYVQWALLTPA